MRISALSSSFRIKPQRLAIVLVVLGLAISFVPIASDGCPSGIGRFLCPVRPGGPQDLGLQDYAYLAAILIVVTSALRSMLEVAGGTRAGAALLGSFRRSANDDDDPWLEEDSPESGETSLREMLMRRRRR